MCDGYTHHIRVHLFEGGTITLGADYPAHTAKEIATEWADRVRKDTAIWGSVLEDSYDILSPGGAVVIPTRSIMLVEIREAPGDDPDPDMADIAAAG